MALLMVVMAAMFWAYSAVGSPMWTETAARATLGFRPWAVFALRLGNSFVWPTAAKAGHPPPRTYGHFMGHNDRLRKVNFRTIGDPGPHLMSLKCPL